MTGQSFFWAKASGTGNEYIVGNAGDVGVGADGGGFNIFIAPASGLVVFKGYSNNGTQKIYQYDFGRDISGETHQYAYSDRAANDFFSLYVDGVLVGSPAAGTIDCDAPGANKVLSIGAIHDRGFVYSSKSTTIWQVAIFDSQLSDGDISALYVAGTTAGTASAYSNGFRVEFTPGPSISFDGPNVTQIDGTQDTPLPDPTPDPSMASRFTVTDGTAVYALAPTSGALPAGVTIDPATGNLVGTPTESGTFPDVIVRGTIS